MTGGHESRPGSSHASAASTPHTPYFPAPVPAPNDPMQGTMGVLADFTTSVSAIASVTVLRENAKRIYAHRDLDYQRFKKAPHPHKFGHAADHVVNARTRALKEFEEHDKKLKYLVHNRDRISQDLTAKVLAAPQQRDSEPIRRLQAEMERLKSQIPDLRKSIADIGNDSVRILSFKNRNVMLEGDIKLAEQRVTHALEKCELLKARFDHFPSANVETSKLREELGALRDKMETFGKSLEDMETLKGQSEKHKAALEKVDEDLERFDREVGGYGQRIAAVESTSPELVKKDLDEFKVEQQARDDIVADAVDSTRATATTLQSQVAELRQETDLAKARVEAAILSTSQRTAGLPHGQAGRDQLWSTLTKLLNQMGSVTAELGQLRHGLDTLFERYGGLTSEHTTQRMLLKMQDLYPQSGNVAQGMEQAKQKQGQLEQKVKEVVVKVEGLASAQDSISPWGGQALKAYVEARFEELHGLIGSLTAENKLAAKELESLKARVESIWSSTSDEFGSMALQLDQLNEHCGLEGLHADEAEVVGDGDARGSAEEAEHGPRGTKRRRAVVEEHSDEDVV
ncbi:MAG: hypothetical protein M1832_001278 [Thelocarpon impressellum]|nr:MAG: hypothetical protein M1832_001278 [Thelocarpon impressellum]